MIIITVYYLIIIINYCCYYYDWYYYLKGVACLSPQGVALATMVGWLSYGNKKFEALDAQMRNLIPPLRQAMLDFIPMVDADTSAFSAFMVEYFIEHDFFSL